MTDERSTNKEWIKQRISRALLPANPNDKDRKSDILQVSLFGNSMVQITVNSGWGVEKEDRRFFTFNFYTVDLCVLFEQARHLFLKDSEPFVLTINATKYGYGDKKSRSAMLRIGRGGKNNLCWLGMSDDGNELVKFPFLLTAMVKLHGSDDEEIPMAKTSVMKAITWMKLVEEAANRAQDLIEHKDAKVIDFGSSFNANSKESSYNKGKKSKPDDNFSDFDNDIPY